MNHPNRQKATRANPTPEQVKAARAAARLTQSQAAAMVHTGISSWQEYEGNRKRMHPAMFQLFLIKTGQEELIVPWQISRFTCPDKYP